MLATSSRVAVVGSNATCALGFSTAEVVDAMLEGVCGIQQHTDASCCSYPFMAAMVNNDRLQANVNQLNISNFTKLEQLFILSILDATKGLSIDFSKPDVHLVLATTKGNIDTVSDAANLPQEAYLWSMADKVANYFGFSHKPTIISNACISGLLAIEHGANLIKTGKYATVVVAGGDLVSEFVLAGFGSFKSLSSEPCKPFDANRDGLSLGEGCATMVLSSNDRLTDNPTYILGGGCSNDANHISGPSRTGDGLYYAIKEAVESSQIAYSDIDWVVPHATATSFNDEMECKAISLAGLQHTPVTGLKGYIGHTLAAAGIIEAVVAAEAMQKSYLLGTKGFNELGVSQPLNVVSVTSKQDVQFCLKTASGFGGCNAALVFARRLPDSIIPKQAEVKYSLLRQVEIQNGEVCIDGRLFCSSSNSEVLFSDFIRECYKQLELSYPKFYKMDDLCKLGLVSAEYLLKDIDLQQYEATELGVMLFTSSSSLDTDSKFQQSITNPSPAVFVYTLANIMAGEIAIKHKLQGRNIVYIQEAFDKELMLNQVADWMENRRIKLCIAGYVDFINDSYKSDLYLFKC